MELNLLKTPIYITDELGPLGSIGLIVVGIIILLLGKLLEGSENSCLEVIGEDLMFKFGIGLALTGLISLPFSFG